MVAAWLRSINNEWLKQTRFLFKDVLLHKSVFTCLQNYRLMNYNTKMQLSQVVLRLKAFSFVKIQGILLRREVFICLKKP